MRNITFLAQNNELLVKNSDFQSYTNIYRKDHIDQGSISPMFYEQLLHTKIPKAQENTDDLTVFFVLLRSARVKAAHKMFVKSTPDITKVRPTGRMWPSNCCTFYFT
jgi:hypothetical protein